MMAIDSMDHSPVWTLTPRVWAGLFCVCGGGRNDARNDTQQLRPIAAQRPAIAAQQIQPLARA